MTDQSGSGPGNLPDPQGGDREGASGSGDRPSPTPSNAPTLNQTQDLRARIAEEVAKAR